MKTLKITALALFATAMVTAQDLDMHEVPTELSETFQNEYRNAMDVEWEKEGANYKVEFDVNDMEHEIWYTNDGTKVKSEMEITKADVPNAITKAIKHNYADYKIDSVEMTEMNGKKTYEVELEKGWFKDMDVVFDANGSVLSSDK
ncbi:PepSY-like domain-containing protein [Psychroserpens mesophilus]|uniref:PepSY-like domain-containing protein n=1 Tax=Psychroserpens mesophilus TaxID=325473 RepID=UPI003D650611